MGRPELSQHGRRPSRSSEQPKSTASSVTYMPQAVLIVLPLLIIKHCLGGVINEDNDELLLNVLVIAASTWMSVGLWRSSTGGLLTLFSGVAARPLLRMSALVVAQSAITIAAVASVSLVKLLTISLMSVVAVEAARTRTIRPLGAVCFTLAMGATLFDGYKDGNATSSILLTAHCVLIVLSRRLIGCPGRNANTTAKDASAAAQRVEQERLWKAAGVTAGPVTGLMILAWIGLQSKSAHLPSESDLVLLLIVTALLSTSILIMSPTSSRFSLSYHPLVPPPFGSYAHTNPARNRAGRQAPVGEKTVLVCLLAASVGLQVVYWGHAVVSVDLGVAAVGLVAVHDLLASSKGNLQTDETPSQVVVAEAYAPHHSPMATDGDMALPAFVPVTARSLLGHILRSPESSKIFYFLLLNLLYMVVQVLWGIWTNSLGLISDSIHMAFDCAALAVGLFASVMATWHPNTQYSYGYGRVETLSGFANGIFLVLISIFIIFEALQRVLNPPEMMNMRQLLVVSSGGLAINLWGMYATGHHHHGHSHGHDHSHGSGCHHSDGHSDEHSHNMRGVFLHVMADTLGSVGVILSTVMIEYTGWTVFDPIASLFIAALIVASVVPLVIDSARVLMLELGEEKEVELRHALAELNAVEGLEFYAAPRFWPKSEGSLIGSIHIRLSPVKAFEDPSRPASESAWAFKKQGGVAYANADKVVAKVETVLKSRIRGLRDLTIQVEGLDCTFCPCSTGAGR